MLPRSAPTAIKAILPQRRKTIAISGNRLKSH